MREQLGKQDQSWEQHKAMELGNLAIMGPKSSPVKRTKETKNNQGAPVSRKRQRTWKLEGWGEPTLAPKEPPPDTGKWLNGEPGAVAIKDELT